MNSTKVARRTTIFKLIGPCEILSHGQKTSTRNWMKDNERKLDLLKVMKKGYTRVVSKIQIKY